jgi:queuine tRNA-ribosyltransferase
MALSKHQVMIVVCEVNLVFGNKLTMSICRQAFVPVATHGTLKGVNSMTARRVVQCMFVNTYHQLVQPPGVDVIGAAGGLHRFINFDKPLFTDSGGFQVFSLGKLQQPNVDINAEGDGVVHDNTIDVTKPELKGQQRGRYEASVTRLSEEGVLFKSYLNGDDIMLTPESSVEAQQKLGADIIVPLDELPSNNLSKQRIQQSLLRTNRWQLRSLATHRSAAAGAASNHQSMYGVVHGGIHHDLRKDSINFVVRQTFEGVAVGGSLGVRARQKEWFFLKKLLIHISYSSIACYLYAKKVARDERCTSCSSSA